MAQNTEEEFQAEMARIFADVEAQKPDTGGWVKIEKYFFDIKEVCAVELTRLDLASNTASVSIHLRNGLVMKTEHVAARKVWQAFTGEELPFSD